MHITMNNIELKEAVELWLENEGLTPDRYDIDVKFVAGRNGNEGRIEINAQKKEDVNSINEPVENINSTIDTSIESTEPKKQKVKDIF